jgi:hypothetical protein
LRGEQGPLVLASVEYLWPIYREANTYPHLLERGVPGNPDRLSEKELHQQAWALVRPVFRESRDRWAALYARLAGTGRTSADIAEIVRASYAGRVEVLFVPLGWDCWGGFEPATGGVTVNEEPRPADAELLNLAALYTLRHGGTVYGVDTGEVRDGSFLAAIYWVSRSKKEAEGSEVLKPASGGA